MSRSNHTVIIQGFQQLTLDIKQHHWNTSSYPEHIALNEAYDSISGYMDTIAETLVGAEGPLSPLKLLPIPSCPIQDLPKDIFEIAATLKMYANSKYPDLVNLADEVTAAGSRLKYLLRLS